jgi:phosphoribosylaminoimidazolecarboxamide formyltransferase/IMP cyclohydrolase
MQRSTQFDFRSLQSGFLVQQADTSVSVLSDAKIVSSRAPTATEEDSLIFAWKMCAQVKSNAIVIAKNEMLIGVGAGQMSRVDSAEIAVHKSKLHGHDLKGAVAASDAFFPFPDGLEFLAAQGISAIIAPGGAKRDPEVIEAANRLGVALLFAPDRHFRH